MPPKRKTVTHKFRDAKVVTKAKARKSPSPAQLKQRLKFKKAAVMAKKMRAADPKLSQAQAIKKAFAQAS